jgi:hypothetical protein
MFLINIIAMVFVGGFVFGSIFSLYLTIIFPNLYYESVWVEINVEYENNAIDIFKGEFKTSGRWGGIVIFRSYPCINVTKDGKKELIPCKTYIRKHFNFPALRKIDAEKQLELLKLVLERNGLNVLDSGLC